MDKVKIQEIAAEAGMSNNDMLEKAKKLGFDVKVAASSISLDQAAVLMDYAMTGVMPAKKEAPKSETEKEKKKTPTKRFQRKKSQPTRKK